MGKKMGNEFLIESSSDGIFAYNVDLELHTCNKQLRELLGLQSDNIIGNSIWQALPFLTQEADTSTVSSVLDDNTQVLKGRAFYHDLSKSYIHYNLIISPVKNDKGEIIGGMGMLQNIQVFEDDSPEHVINVNASQVLPKIVFDLEGNPTFFNDSYRQLWDITPKVERYVFDHYNLFKDEQLIDHDILTKIKSSTPAACIEVPLIRYDTRKTNMLRSLALKQKTLSGYIYPQRNESGEISSLEVTLIDMTSSHIDKLYSDFYLKFQKLTKNLPAVIYEHVSQPGGANYFRYISNNCKEIFGLTDSEIQQNPTQLKKLIHSDDIVSYLQSVKRSEVNFTQWEWEGCFVVDSEEKWIRGTSRPERVPGGNIVRYGLLIDITAERQAVVSESMTEKRLELALRGGDLGLWDWYLDTGQFVTDKRFALIAGYDDKAMESVITNWLDNIHPDERDGAYDGMIAHIKGQTSYFDIEMRIKNPNGGWKWVHSKGQVTEWGEDRRAKRLTGTIQDIDERKRTEGVLKRSQLMLSQLFGNVPMGIVLLDERRKVVEINNGFENIFGYTNEEAIGKKLNQLIIPQESRGESINLNELIVGGKTIKEVETLRKAKDGSMVPVMIYGVPVTLKDKVIAIYGIYVDITARKSAEGELKIRNEELDNFVYKVSHDLRAPLSSTLGLIHLARLEGSDADLRHYVDLIESRISQLDRFIGDVLSHSKNLNMEVNSSSIDFEQIIQESFEELHYLPAANMIKREINISDHSFHNDHWRVSEVLRNLISNAIKYLNPEIDDPYIKIDITINEEQAVIHFEDNGIGIAEEMQSQVFDMFYRATEYSEGSGIGLYIVKNAIEKMGGSITMTSAQYQGTTFDITIPNNA